MKTHVEPTIRDIPSLLALAPWYGKKHRDNTLTMKRFTNGRGFWCLGGKAAKNYREKSVDVAGYDELAAFDDDIEQEGSPTFLGDKRIEGSVWPKSIRGSTPKVRGTCQIERAASESPHFMRFHVACPHCGEEQYLKFGDKETPFGLKWTPDDPSSVFYLCEHNACVIRQQELDFTDARYICEKTGIWTRDGILWFSSSGEEIEPPDSVTFHIWTAYSPFTTWVQIVKDWMKTKGDTGKRKTFVNTTLGETWEAKIGERPDAEVMAERKEHYSAPVPDRVAYLTAGIDSQLDRYEMRVWGWGPGEESWLIDRQIIMGRHDDEQTLLRVDEAINKTYNPSVFKDTYQYGYTSSGQNTWGVQGSVGMSTGWLANTSIDGNHSHSLSGTAASAGAHAHTVGIGAHTHSVAIGSHGHTITVNAAGNAENTVKNIAFNYIVRLA